MLRNESIKRRFKTAAAALAVFACAAAFVQPANAGCFQYDVPKKSVSNWSTPESFFGSARFVKAGYLRVADEGYAPGFFRAPITGMWAFKFTSKGNSGTLGIPDGAPIDNGNTSWFADGNEVTYSGGRDPVTGSVCLGIWQQTGERTYEVNHIGLAWDPVNHVAAGPSFIKEWVTLAKDGNSYSGSFQITPLQADGVTPALPAPILGVISATRVTQNTTTQVP